MVRIPRFEPQVAPAMQDQPFSSGDGYAAQGVALQKLGSGMADLGKGLDAWDKKAEAEAEKQAAYKDNLTLLTATNEADRELITFEKTYTGDGSDFEAKAFGILNQKFEGVREQMTSRDGRAKFDLRQQGLVGQRQESFMRKGYEIREKALFEKTKETIVDQFARLDEDSKSDESTFMPKLEQHMRDVGTIIKNMPHGERREALVNQAAGLAEAAMAARGHKELPIVRDWLKKWHTERDQTAPGAVPGPGAEGPSITPNLTAYAPRAGGDRMEGGYASSKPGPDGKAVVRTLADVAAGKSKYVTIAGNPRDYGKTFTIPKIAFIDAKGQTQELINVRAVVHDTGGAFKTAPDGRFDVPIDRDASDAQMAKSHTMWKQAGVQFVQQGVGQAASGGGGVRPASAGEYLTAKLAKGYESRKSDVANLHPVMQDRLAAFVAAAEDQGHDIRVLSGHRDAARQAVLWEQALKKYGSAEAARKWVAPPGTSTHSTGEAVDLQYGDRGGGLGGKKTAAVAWAHENAAKYGLHFPLGHEDWHIEPNEARAGGKRHSGQYAAGQPMYQGGGRMAAGGPSEPVPVAQRGITAGMRPNNTIQGEQQPTSAGNNTIPVSDDATRVAGSPVQVAQAPTGTMNDAGPQTAPGAVERALAARLLKNMKVIEQRHMQSMEADVKAVAELAGKGILPPSEQLDSLRGVIAASGNGALAANLESLVIGAQTTAQYQRATPIEIDALARSIRAQMIEGKKTPQASLGLVAQVEALEKLHDKISKELKSDPIGLAVRTGQIPNVQPVTKETFSPEVLAQRIEQARAVAARYENGLQVFTVDERKWMTEEMKKGGKPMEDMLGMMAATFGPDTPHAMKEFAKEAPIAAQLGWLVARGGNREVVRDLSLGIAKMQDEKHKSIAPPPAAAWSEAIKVMGVGLAQQAGPNGDSQQATIDAANILYDVRARAKGLDKQGTNFDASLWQNGLKEILGENKVGDKTYGGVSKEGAPAGWSPNTWTNSGNFHYIVPPNIAQDAIPKLLANLKITDVIGGLPVAKGTADIAGFDAGTIGETAAAMRLQGTAPPPNDPVGSRGEPVSMATIRHAKLVTIGDGRYWLATGNVDDPKYIKTLDGRNWELNIHKYESVLRQRVPDAYRDAR